MKLNLRKYLSQEKDVELLRLRSEAGGDISRANHDFEKIGGTTLEKAGKASYASEISTVAGAIIRERVESSDDYGHLDLQGCEAVSPKRVNSNWGRWLSNRRRI